MPDEIPPARVAGSRATPATVLTSFFVAAPEPPTSLEDFMDVLADVPGGVDHERRRDPAVVVAEVMVAAYLAASVAKLDAVLRRGAVVVVQVPGVEWLEPVRHAWRREVTGEEATRKAGTHGIVGSWPPMTYTFTAEAPPSRKDHDERDNGLFATVVGHGQSTVGFTPEISWLPADLVAAMDECLVLATPTATELSEAARRLTLTESQLVLGDDEAARVTPRLLRLSVRPDQEADEYLLKLRAVLAREAAATAAAAPAAKPRTVRDRPTLDRIHGMDEAVAWGLQLCDDLDAYRKGERPWSDVDGGLLLSGPTGTGKTMFARALAATCGVPLVAGSYGAWLATGTAHQGDLLKAMRAAFEEAKAAAPAILFIDEVDSFPDRARAHQNQEWTTDVVNALLAEIDGVEGREGVVVIGACNHPDRLDPALVRSGRLDRHVRVGLPGPEALASILRVHLGVELPGEDLREVGMLLLGATGADVERLVREARRRARMAGRGLEMADVVHHAGGEETRSADDLLLAAVHEAGHAVSAVALGIDIDGVTLRGGPDRGGMTRLRCGPDQLTAGDVHDRLVFQLSGRAAEEIVLKRVTSGSGGPAGAGSDLERATVLAVRSAAELGLEKDHGLTWTPLPDRETELSAMLAGNPRLEKLVRARLATAYGDARDLVERERRGVRSLAGLLLERGAVGVDEVRDALGKSETVP